MPKGGARIGAGRPKDLTKAAKRLEKIRATMQDGFYESAFKLATAIPKLTEQAIMHAEAGDKGLLKFLLTQFYDIVGALPAEDQSKYADLQSRLISIIEDQRNRPRDLGAAGAGDPRDAGAIPLKEDGNGVFRAGEDQASDGGRA